MSVDTDTSRPPRYKLTFAHFIIIFVVLKTRCTLASESTNCIHTHSILTHTNIQSFVVLALINVGAVRIHSFTELTNSLV